MAYSNSTTNYNLPIYSAGDIASWTDTNQSFADIDAATYTAYQTAASAAQDVSTLDGTVSTLSGTVAGHTSTLSTLTTTTIPAMQNAILGAATANGTSYSNTVSGLTATDVQDAIDEVLDGQKWTSVASVTTDATTVYTDMLNTLYTGLNTAYKSGNYKEYVFKITSSSGKVRYCHLNEALADSNYCFDYLEYAGTSVYTYALMLKSTGSERRYITINSAGTVTSTDGSSGTPGAGAVYEIFAR